MIDTASVSGAAIELIVIKMNRNYTEVICPPHGHDAVEQIVVWSRLALFVCFFICAIECFMIVKHYESQI